MRIDLKQSARPARQSHMGGIQTQIRVVLLACIDRLPALCREILLLIALLEFRARNLEPLHAVGLKSSRPEKVVRMTPFVRLAVMSAGWPA